MTRLHPRTPETATGASRELLTTLGALNLLTGAFNLVAGVSPETDPAAGEPAQATTWQRKDQ